MSRGMDYERVIDGIFQAPPVVLSKPLRAICAGLILLGMLSFAVVLGSEAPQRAWAALQINFLFWFGLAAAMSGFSAVFHITGAAWARPVERLFQSAFPLFAALPLCLILLFFGRTHLFLWTQHLPAGREAWFNAQFLYGRDLAGSAVLIFLVWRLHRLLLRRDLGLLRSSRDSTSGGEETGRWAEPHYDRFVAGWSADTAAEVGRANASISRLSPPIVVVYALVMSLIAFDQLMSVDSHWYSALFGVFYFMSAVYAAFAAACILAGVLKARHPYYAEAIGRATLHDLGKLLFGFGVFWAYLFWSHYLPIWYGNIPEETHWVIIRLREEPWHGLSWLTFAMGFIIPFFIGLSRSVKKEPLLLGLWGAMVLVALWLAHYIMFMPTLSPERIPFSAADLGVTLAFLGAFVLSSSFYLRRFPAAPVPAELPRTAAAPEAPAVH